MGGNLPWRAKIHFKWILVYELRQLLLSRFSFYIRKIALGWCKKGQHVITTKDKILLPAATAFWPFHSFRPGWKKLHMGPNWWLRATPSAYFYSKRKHASGSDNKSQILQKLLVEFCLRQTNN